MTRINDYYFKFGSTATQKKYVNLGLKDGWLREKFGKLGKNVKKRIHKNKPKDSLGRFTNVDKK